MSAERHAISGGDALRSVPIWVAPLFAVLGVATVPWTVYLSMTLPQHARITTYRTAWVGFDVILVIALLATAHAAWRGHWGVGLVASATATLLVVDAWFDVTTSSSVEFVSAMLSAVLVELPLALLCTWIALHVDRFVNRRLRQLAGSP